MRISDWSSDVCSSDLRLMTAPSPTTALPDADAGRRNMTLLIQLRWLAVGGQLATIAVVIGLMDIALPLAPLLAAVAVLAAINELGRASCRERVCQYV